MNVARSSTCATAVRCSSRSRRWSAVARHGFLRRQRVREFAFAQTADREDHRCMWVTTRAQCCCGCRSCTFGGLDGTFGVNLPLSLRAHVLAVQARLPARSICLPDHLNPFPRIANPPDRGSRPSIRHCRTSAPAVHPLIYLAAGFPISLLRRRRVDRRPDRRRLGALVALDAGGMDLPTPTPWAPTGPVTNSAGRLVSIRSRMPR